MGTLLVFSVWCILFLLCWPLALPVLVLAPAVWLVALPFRLIGLAVSGTFALLGAILPLPARRVGWRPAAY